MILNQTRVEQAIDRDVRAPFVKELVVVRFPAKGGFHVPLAMVRKRCPSLGGGLGTILLTHGFGQNRYAWHLPARSLSNHLAHAGFDVFNLDLRGHGRSRHFGARAVRHVDDYITEDLPTAIDEVRLHSGDRPVFLVGHSLGGLVSYGAAPVLAGGVAGVVSIGSPYHFTRGSL